MPLRFVDAHGEVGRIGDELSLSYGGAPRIDESVRGLIDEVQANVMDTDEQLETLIVELPGECPVREIERVDDRS